MYGKDHFQTPIMMMTLTNVLTVGERREIQDFVHPEYTELNTLTTGEIKLTKERK